MKRKIDLIRYLPDVIKDNNILNTICSSQSSELVLLFDELSKTKNNFFITTADEYGISQFEKLLDITPNLYDDLETRRIRVSFLWNNNIPYTWNKLIQILDTICGVGEYEIARDGFNLHLKTYKVQAPTNYKKHQTPKRTTERVKVIKSLPKPVLYALYSSIIKIISTKLSYSHPY